MSTYASTYGARTLGCGITVARAYRRYRPESVFAVFHSSAPPNVLPRSDIHVVCVVPASAPKFRKAPPAAVEEFTGKVDVQK